MGGHIAPVAAGAVAIQRITNAVILDGYAVVAIPIDQGFIHASVSAGWAPAAEVSAVAGLRVAAVAIHPQGVVGGIHTTG